jgi:hypothetical protein
MKLKTGAYYEAPGSTYYLHIYVIHHESDEYYKVKCAMVEKACSLQVERHVNRKLWKKNVRQLELV